MMRPATVALSALVTLVAAAWPADAPRSEPSETRPSPPTSAVDHQDRALLCHGALTDLELVSRHVQGDAVAMETQALCPVGKAPLTWGYESTLAAEQWRIVQSYPWSEGDRRGWRVHHRVDPAHTQAIPGKQSADARRPYSVTLHLLCATCATTSPTPPAGTTPLASACRQSRECASGHCVDGVCCDRACGGTCESCRLPARQGRCGPVPVGTDPDDECAGPDPQCQGRCGAGVCDFPLAGTPCGLCRICDGLGQCNRTPQDDPACGILDCDGLDSKCRDYDDLRSRRCLSFGRCKPENDPVTCVIVGDVCAP